MYISVRALAKAQILLWKQKNVELLTIKIWGTSYDTVSWKEQIQIIDKWASAIERGSNYSISTLIPCPAYGFSSRPSNQLPRSNSHFITTINLNILSPYCGINLMACISQELNELWDIKIEEKRGTMNIPNTIKTITGKI